VKKTKIENSFYFIGLFYSGSSHTAVDIKYLCLTVKGKGWLCYNLEIGFLLKIFCERNVLLHNRRDKITRYSTGLSIHWLVVFAWPVHQTLLKSKKRRGALVGNRNKGKTWSVITLQLKGDAHEIPVN
jgi:hypothetical protein